MSKYRNGREARNGDKVIQLGRGDGTILIAGQVSGLTPGMPATTCAIQPMHGTLQAPELADCLHIDDVAAMLAEKGLDKRAPN